MPSTVRPATGRGGRGDGPAAAHLDPQPRDHTDPSRMGEVSDQRIAETIKVGGIMYGFPSMPSNPSLSAEQIEALVVYVRRLSDPAAATVDLTGFTR